MRISLLAAVLVGVTSAGAAAASEDVELPSTIATTAYDVGSTGYSNMVAISSALKNKYGVNLRVLPGKNDVARIIPLAEGKVDLGASGTDSVFAQEGVFVFGRKGWGPVPLRVSITSVTRGANVAFAVTEKGGIRKIEDLKGKRVAFIRGGPTSEQHAKALLAFGGLTWDDVVRVEQPGFAAQARALVEGQVDAIATSTTAPDNLRQEASPLGLHFIELPHDNKEGWERLQSVVPWLFPQVATEGPTLPPEGKEMSASPYPILLALDSKDADFVYNMTKAVVLAYPDYKDAVPGSDGWALERQKFDGTFIPHHEGAVRYYKEIGVWKPEYETRRDELIQRQEVLQKAWADYTAASGDQDEQAFEQGWMKARADALNAAGLITIVDNW